MIPGKMANTKLKAIELALVLMVSLLHSLKKKTITVYNGTFPNPGKITFLDQANSFSTMGHSGNLLMIFKSLLIKNKVSTCHLDNQEKRCVYWFSYQ